MNLSVEIRPVSEGGLVVVGRGAPVLPYERQTQKTRFRQDARGDRAKRYNDWKAMVAETVGLAMKQQNLEPLAGDLKLSFVAFIKPKGIRGDASNYLKALEDACNTVLWGDDRQIVKFGESSLVRVSGLEGFTMDVRTLAPVAAVEIPDCQAIDRSEPAKEEVKLYMPKPGERVLARTCRERDVFFEAVFVEYSPQIRSAVLRDDKGTVSYASLLLLSPLV